MDFPAEILEDFAADFAADLAVDFRQVDAFVDLNLGVVQNMGFF